jgi:hypothetical protein
MLLSATPPLLHLGLPENTSASLVLATDYLLQPSAALKWRAGLWLSRTTATQLETPPLLHNLISGNILEHNLSCACTGGFRATPPCIDPTDRPGTDPKSPSSSWRQFTTVARSFSTRVIHRVKAIFSCACAWISMSRSLWIVGLFFFCSVLLYMLRLCSLHLLSRVVFDAVRGPHGPPSCHNVIDSPGMHGDPPLANWSAEANQGRAGGETSGFRPDILCDCRLRQCGSSQVSGTAVGFMESPSRLEWFAPSHDPLKDSSRGGGTSQNPFDHINRVLVTMQ